MQLSPSAYADTFCRDHLPAASDWPELRFSLPAMNYPARLNCAEELLEGVIRVHGADRPCLLSGDERWSYRDLLRVSSQIAGVLAEDLGLVPGNRVLLRGPNNPWLVACWFGVLRAGGVAVATMPLLRAGELVSICEIAQVSLALCDSRLTAELTRAGSAAAGPASRRCGSSATGRRSVRPHPAGARQAGGGGSGADGRRRRRHDRVHVGHHRPAQGHHAFPP